MGKLAIAVFSILLNVGCSQQLTFESFFHEKLKKMHIGEVDYTYELVKKEFNVIHEDDAIAVFKENNEHGGKIFIAYFEKEDKQWEWKHTRGTEWNSPIKWTSMNQAPFIYSGDEPAKIINVEEDKRFWYAISPTNDVEVMMVKER
ncbi:hypothetical protein [Sporosarcina sp. NPDC096371]|uniref:hypothetical protein n=1 Tax=Sporosarcina sp. NPDC096371 TaxID=3364530 RepID=UPI0037FE5431